MPVVKKPKRKRRRPSLAERAIETLLAMMGGLDQRVTALEQHVEATSPATWADYKYGVEGN